jgi:putative ABC transport system permease protein
MLVIVRERRREIGVLKAIGGSNGTIVTQFMVEALVLVVLGTIVGLGLTLGASSGIAQALVSTSTSTTNTTSTDAGPSVSTSGPQDGVAIGGPRGGGFRTFRLGANGGDLKSSAELVGTVATSVGPLTLLWGALAALGIAIVGSAIPAWLIAKVRPAEVMRGE